MERVGSISWSLSESRPQLPHAALFVRDAASLVVPAGASIPPALNGDPPDLSRAVEEAQRRAAGPQWASWWEDIVERELHPAAHDQSAGLDSGLGDRPGLHSVVRALFDAAHQWGNGPTHTADHGRGTFDGEMLGETVHAVTTEFGRDAAAASGRVVVLDVQGIWWQLFSPGGAMCSIEAANDPTTARLIVTEVFRSSLATPR